MNHLATINGGILISGRVILWSGILLWTFDHFPWNHNTWDVPQPLGVNLLPESLTACPQKNLTIPTQINVIFQPFCFFQQQTSLWVYQQKHGKSSGSPRLVEVKNLEILLVPIAPRGIPPRLGILVEKRNSHWVDCKEPLKETPMISQLLVEIKASWKTCLLGF